MAIVLHWQHILGPVSQSVTKGILTNTEVALSLRVINLMPFNAVHFKYFYSYVIGVTETARAVMTWESCLTTQVLTPFWAALLSIGVSSKAFNTVTQWCFTDSQRPLGDVVFWKPNEFASLLQYRTFSCYVQSLALSTIRGWKTQADSSHSL